MSLNHIQLNPNMLAGLYTDKLVEGNRMPSASVQHHQPDTQEPKFLGSNRKNIVVVINNGSAAFLPDDELAFLSSILAACKLSLADIAIVNLANTSSAALESLIHARARTVLLFGIGPLSIGLPINFPEYQLQAFDQRTYLHAPPLSLLQSDKSQKLKLWNSLKNLFGIA
ncbi:MAG TPA: hypothetical protein VFR58_16195 [Flavisolibacter sp.]|nr:hypothetical protein [Flavisolibacter sp.]